MHSHLSQTCRDRRRKTVIIGHTFGDTARLRNEDHVELGVAGRDRFLQLLDKCKSQFNTSSVSIGHDGVGSRVLLLPLRPKGMAQPFEAVADNIPNTAFSVEAVNYAVATNSPPFNVK